MLNTEVLLHFAGLSAMNISILNLLPDAYLHLGKACGHIFYPAYRNR